MPVPAKVDGLLRAVIEQKRLIQLIYAGEGEAANGRTARLWGSQRFG